MESHTLLLKWQSTELENPADLAFEVQHGLFVMNVEHFSGQDVVPVGHDLVVFPVVVSKLEDVVGEVLTFAPKLLVISETAINRVAARMT